jgi:hypothetical protein
MYKLFSQGRDICSHPTGLAAYMVVLWALGATHPWGGIEIRLPVARNYAFLTTYSFKSQSVSRLTG